MKDNIRIETIMGGEIIDRINEAIGKVMENCFDTETTLKPREVVMKMVVTPSKTRSHVGIQFEVTPKLAGMEPGEVLAELLTDDRGRPYARESNRRGKQMTFDHSKVTKIGGTE